MTEWKLQKGRLCLCRMKHLLNSCMFEPEKWFSLRTSPTRSKLLPKSVHLNMLSLILECSQNSYSCLKIQFKCHSSIHPSKGFIECCLCTRECVRNYGPTMKKTGTVPDLIACAVEWISSHGFVWRELPQGLLANPSLRPTFQLPEVFSARTHFLAKLSRPEEPETQHPLGATLNQCLVGVGVLNTQDP